MKTRAEQNVLTFIPTHRWPTKSSPTPEEVQQALRREHEIETTTIYEMKATIRFKYLVITTLAVTIKIFKLLDTSLMSAYPSNKDTIRKESYNVTDLRQWVTQPQTAMGHILALNAHVTISLEVS